MMRDGLPEMIEAVIVCQEKGKRMSQNRLEELINEASSFPPGLQKIEAFERAIAEAEVLGEPDVAFKLRSDLIQSAVFNGQGDRAIVAFAAHVKHADQNRATIDPRDLLGKYKWILNPMVELPQIPKAKILDMISDMSRRVEAAGYSQRAVFYKRWQMLTEMGDFDAAAVDMLKWQSATKDGLKDCEACETNSEVYFWAATQNNEKALEIARPILEGKLTCALIPQNTLGNVIRPLMRQGRIDDAVKFAEKGYRLTSKNEEHLCEVSEFLLVAIHTNALVRAKRIFSKHAIWALKTGCHSPRLRFNSVASAFLKKLDQGKLRETSSEGSETKKRKATSSVRLQLPSEHPLYRPDAKYDISELAAWYQNEAQNLAQQFDQRNGNRYASQCLKETYKLAGVDYE